MTLPPLLAEIERMPHVANAFSRQPAPFESVRGAQFGFDPTFRTVCLDRLGALERLVGPCQNCRQIAQ
jgi:hypothetical protein